jgi:hypothetical protein
MVQPCPKNLHSSISNVCFTKIYGISSMEIHSNYKLNLYVDSPSLFREISNILSDCFDGILMED